MRVLHVIGRVLARLFDRELEVEVERAVSSALEEEPPRDVRADAIQDVLELDELPTALRHAEDLSLVEEAHELVDHDVPSLEQAEGLQSGAHAEHVPVRVRPPDVDLPIEPAVDQRLPVIGEVDAEVRRRSRFIRADEHRVDVLPEVAALEPDGPVAVLDDTKTAQLGDRLAEIVAAGE